MRQAPGRLHTGAGLDEGLGIWHGLDGVDGRAGQVGEAGEGLVAEIPSWWQDRRGTQSSQNRRSSGLTRR